MIFFFLRKGQIFCSKCASNLIPGGNFSHEGLMRVCDFCLKLMKEYAEDYVQGISEKNEFNNSIQRQIHTSSLLPDNHNIVAPEFQYTLPSPNSYGQVQNLPPPRAPSPDTLSLNDGISIKKMMLSAAAAASSSLFMTRSRSNMKVR